MRAGALDKRAPPLVAGARITIASVQATLLLFARVNAAFEDARIDYLNLPAVRIGCAISPSLGIETITSADVRPGG